MKHFNTIGVTYIGLLLLAGCSSSTETTQEELKGLAYDPPGSTITTNKITYSQHKRTFLFGSKKLYVSNEFTGSRLNDFYQDNDSTFIGVIEPENSPINNSAWYAFKIWADEPAKINLQLKYKDGSQRYVPKLSRDGDTWKPIDSSLYFNDTSKGIGNLRLTLTSDTLWVSAQELILSNKYNSWMNKLAEKSFVKKSLIGKSAKGREINKIEITETAENEGLIFIIGRQHPPEVTGAFGLMAFVEKLADNSDLSKRFRKKFKIVAIPLVNPDGVDEGHWRHNSNGVDLNRDWFAFNQPETKLVRDELLKINNDSQGKAKFFFDFHSTQEDVFYITSKDTTLEHDPIYETTKNWLDGIQEMLPNYKINIDASPNDVKSPTSDGWAYNALKCPALTYEFGDEDDREFIRKFSYSAAESMMKLFLTSEGK